MALKVEHTQTSGTLSSRGMRHIQWMMRGAAWVQVRGAAWVHVRRRGARGWCVRSVCVHTLCMSHVSHSTKSKGLVRCSSVKVPFGRETDTAAIMSANLSACTFQGEK